MNKLKTKNRLLFIGTVTVYIIALFAYCFWDYAYRKSEILENIDIELYNSAVALKYILPDDFHDRAIDERAISINEDKYIAHKLTKLIKETGIKYTYTIVKKGDKLFFVASDITADPETKRGTFYFYPYEEADESFLKALGQKIPTYKTVSDQWGTVRTVMVPEKSPGGINYLACADYDISYVNGVLQKNILRSIVTVLLLLLLSVPIIIIYTKSHSDYMDSLRESEEKYRSIFENAVEGFFQSTPEGRFISVNPVLARMLGYTSPKELISTISDIAKQYYANPEDRSRYTQLLLKDGSVEHFEFKVRCKDGSQIWVSNSTRAVYDRNGKVVRYEGNVNDITQRKQAEESLRESEEKHRSMMEAMKDPVYICSPDFRVEYMNPAMIRRTGYDATGEDCFKALHDLDKKCPWCSQEKILAKEHVELEIVSPKDNRFYHISLTPIVHGDGSISKMSIFKDITDFKKMKAQLQQAQKMEAIGTLAGGIAHDFNNILSAILGYSELVLADLPSEDSNRNKLEAIHSSGERARDLVAQILAFSRKDEQVRSPVEVHLILKDALKLLRPAIPTTIDIQTQITSKCRVLGDPSRVHQIIMNLCTNAFQAMLETGGTLKISLSPVKMEGKAAALAQIPAGSYGKLIISDTGVGIPSENIERIFDPYFTTKEKGKGTGLGLAAVHGIVKSHGGAILVESQIGKGTSFEVYLPLTLDRNAAEGQAKVQIVGGNERILLVDDEHDILEIEEEMLKMQGYIITAKDNAIDALKLFASQPDQFDLVITDMTMPNMTGDKFAGELSKIRPDIPIILCTGFSALMSKEKADSLGIKGFLMKPVTMRDLSDMIRKVLDDTESPLR